MENYIVVLYLHNTRPVFLESKINSTPISQSTLAPAYHCSQDPWGEESFLPSAHTQLDRVLAASTPVYFSSPED